MAPAARVAWRHVASSLARAARVLRIPELPRRARWQLLYIGFAKHLMPAKDYVVQLGAGSVFLSSSSLVTDQRAFDEIFVERCYPARFRNATVIDVGAHKGYLGAFALLAGAACVQSFEPEQANWRCLQAAAATFRAQGCDWSVDRSAVSDQAGQGKLYVSDESWAHSLLPGLGLQATAQDAVPVRSMSSILQAARSLPGERLVVKVDAEGSECRIFLGTPVEYWRTADEILVEVHSFAPCQAEQIVSHLERAGFALEAELVGGIVHLTQGSQSK